MNNRNAAALVIGIGKYSRATVRPLKCAERDAVETYNVLVDQEHCGFPKSNVRLLTDASATRESVIQSLTSWLPSISTGADLAVLYFAGHGVEVAESNGSRAYLVPHDGDLDKAPTWCIPVDDIRRWLGGIKSRAFVAIFDCCHSGSLAEPRGTTRGGDSHQSMSDNHLQALAVAGRCVLASCKSGQQSWEYEDLGHGLFTHFLLKGLRGEAAEAKDSLGRVALLPLCEYVAQRVRAESTSSYAQPQEPWISAQLGGDIPPIAGGVGRIDDLLAKLADIGKTCNLLRLPLVLRCLVDSVDAVRAAARVCWQKVGWQHISEEIVRWATAKPALPVRIETALDLFEKARFEEATPVLCTLAERLTGDLRLRAKSILDKYLFAAELKRVQNHFNKSESSCTIVKAIGRDQQTAVYAAQHAVTHHQVTIRILHEVLAQDPDKVAAFLEYCRSCFRYGHPNLLTVKDVVANQVAKLYYLVRENAEGQRLSTLLRGGTLDARARLSILRQVMSALKGVHRFEMGHGAVKPSNVFVDERLFVRLGDPRLEIPLLALPRNELVNDARYMAPEAFGIGKPSMPAADFYSLGCIAFELHWGRPPFDGEDEAKLQVCHITSAIEWPRDPGKLPTSVVGLLERLLDKSPANRLVDAVRVEQWLDMVASEPVANSGRPLKVAPVREETDDWATSTRFEPKAEVAKAEVAKAEEERAMTTMAMSGPGVGQSKATGPSAPPIAAVGASSSDLDELLRSLPTANGYPVLDPCILQGKLGAGGTGIVFRARHLALDVAVAVKILKPTVASSAAATKRFFDEAKLAARVQHPNLLRVYDVRNRDGIYYIVLEFVEGASADRLVRRRGALQIGEVLTILRAVGGGLSAAHDKSIVHRDVKPGNILVSLDGIVKLSDLGLGGVVGATKDESNTIAGTPAYMPPEQWHSLEEVGPAGDVFGLGATAFHLLTGSPPPVTADGSRTDWAEKAWNSVVAPPALVAILRRATASAPDDRYPNARAFLEVIEALDVPSQPVRVPHVRVRSMKGLPLGRIPMSVDSDLLAALIEKGLATDRHDRLTERCQQLYACRSGMCGLCISRVASGAENLSAIDAREARSLRLQTEFLDAEQNRGLSGQTCRLTCRAFHTGPGDIELDLLGNTDAQGPTVEPERQSQLGPSTDEVDASGAAS